MGPKLKRKLIVNKIKNKIQVNEYFQPNTTNKFIYADQNENGRPMRY